MRNSPKCPLALSPVHSLFIKWAVSRFSSVDALPSFIRAYLRDRINKLLLLLFNNVTFLLIRTEVSLLSGALLQALRGVQNMAARQKPARCGFSRSGLFFTFTTLANLGGGASGFTAGARANLACRC
jgi:hypothetical protein